MSAMLPLLFLTAALVSQAPPQDPTPTVTVPTFANSTCPIMGKKASLPLFADTEYGRIYVCCKPCIRKVHTDVQKAYETAYPVTKDLLNKVCPVSGEPTGAQPDAKSEAQPASVVLQGLRIQLCCEGCLAEARQHAQITLAKAQQPKLDDVQNSRCPVDGQPVQPNAFAVVDATIVRLSSPSHLTEIQKAPQVLLDKARAARKDDGPKPAHRHRAVPQPEKPAPDKHASEKHGAAPMHREGA